jgi:pSer/pThr/pTyr-binding forkhead associated (FHA) protein
MPTLLALSIGPDIPVDGGVVLVGRHPECDVRLDSLRVSRRHCLLTTERGAVVVRDLGSTNGTWINGRRVRDGRIRPGDQVSIAHVRYLLEGTRSLSVAEGPVPDRPEDGSESLRSCHGFE